MYTFAFEASFTVCRWLSQVSIKGKSTVVGVIFAIFGMLYPSLSVLNLLVAIGFVSVILTEDFLSYTCWSLVLF